MAREIITRALTNGSYMNSSKRPVKVFQIHGAFLERVVLRRENLETRVMTLKVAIMYQ
jgi:hypothetical protein